MMSRLRWRTVKCGVVAALGCGLMGCSVHPLPQDVARASTYRIVERIRCEVKEGLADAARPDPRDPKGLHVKRIVEGTTIGFEFEFVIAEEAKAAVDQIVFHRKGAASEGFTLSLNAALNGDHNKDNRTRKNTRIFRIVDDLKDLHDAKCDGKTAPANPIYPITGATGMAEVVRTYIELERLTDLDSDKEDTVFSDRLDFTTTFEAGVATDLKLDTAVGSLRLTRASGTGSALRMDKHSVTVALGRDKAHADVDLPEGVRRMAGLGKATKATTRFPVEDIRDKRLQTVLGQRGKLARNRILLELQRRRNLAEDDTVVARVLGLPAP